MSPSLIFLTFSFSLFLSLLQFYFTAPLMKHDVLDVCALLNDIIIKHTAAFYVHILKYKWILLCYNFIYFTFYNVTNILHKQSVTDYTFGLRFLSALQPT